MRHKLPDYIDSYDRPKTSRPDPRALNAAKAREAKKKKPPAPGHTRNFSALAWIGQMFRSPKNPHDETERDTIQRERMERWGFLTPEKKSKIVYQLLAMGWTGEKILAALNINGEKWRAIHERLRTAQHIIRYSDKPVKFWQALEVDRYEHVIASLMEEREYKKAADVQDQLLTNLRAWGIIEAGTTTGGGFEFLKEIQAAWDRKKSQAPAPDPMLESITKTDPKPSMQ